MIDIVWILSEQIGPMFKDYGAVSNEIVSERWCQLKPKDSSDQRDYNFRRAIKLDDPELLNRIARESENKNESS